MSLTTNALYELPIEHLCKAIYLLDRADELGQEVVPLKRKLEAYFAMIPEIKGIKSYSNYRYYPNGLCEATTGSMAIVLTSWQSLTIPLEETEEAVLMRSIEKEKHAKPKKKKPHEVWFKALDEICSFWGYQLMHHMNIKCKPKKELKNQKPFTETMQLLQQYENLPLETQTILYTENQALLAETKKIRFELFQGKQTGFVLLERDLQQLVHLAEACLENLPMLMIRMDQFIDRIKITPEHCPFQFAEPNRHWNSNNEGITERQKMDRVDEWLQSIQDPNALSVLKKINLIA